jgi:uncharacterized membrane protein
LLLLLMPMSLFQAASLSADATTNGLAILFVSLVLRELLRPEYSENTSTRYSRSHVLNWTALAGTSAILSLTKFAYLPISALVLVIPAFRAVGMTRYLTIVTLLNVVNLATVFLWSSQMHGLDTVLRDEQDVSPRRQVQYLEAHPVSLIAVPISTFKRDGWLIFRSFVGRLGSMDTPLSIAFILPYFAALVLAAWLSDGGMPSISPRNLSIVIVSSILLSVTLIGFLNYVYWAPVGARFIEGLQGRYFIPLAPAVILLIWSTTRRFSQHAWARIPAWILNCAAAMIALVSCCYTVIAVLLRYHGK